MKQPRNLLYLSTHSDKDGIIFHSVIQVTLDPNQKDGNEPLSDDAFRYVWKHGDPQRRVLVPRDNLFEIDKAVKIAEWIDRITDARIAVMRAERALKEVGHARMDD